MATSDSTRPLPATLLVALGIACGDVGANPLFVLRECFRGNQLALHSDGVCGTVSLILWSLTLVVVGKYLLYLRSAVQLGEGGVVVLTALATSPPQKPGVRRLCLALGVVGGAIVLGQAAVGPAIAVLGAVENLGGVSSFVAIGVLPISIAVLSALFAIQHKGSRVVGLVFAPVLLLWFAAQASFGALAIADAPSILRALNPVYALKLLTSSNTHALGILAPVFLSVTGAEALYATVGHASSRAVRLMWATVVGPALLLSYLGQGATLLVAPHAAQDPLLAMTPAWARLPMIWLSAAASIVAAQGIISSVFSLARQTRLFGLLVGLLKGVEVRATNTEAPGQVYAPLINGALAVATIGLVLSFRASGALVPTYLTLVSASMTIVTLLAFPASLSWGWSLWRATLVTSFFLICDVAFLSANISRAGSGSWVLCCSQSSA